MDKILDYIFFQSYRSLLIITVFFIFSLFLGKLRPFKNKPFNHAYMAFCYGFPVLLLIISFVISPYYGYADKFLKIFNDGRHLYLLEQTLSTSPGEAGEESYYRLHVVDMETGKRINRKYLGNFDYADLNLISGSQLLYCRKRGCSLLNTADLNSTRTYEIDTLSSYYPRLMPGVSTMTCKNTYIEIDSKNGRKYYLEPLTGGLFDKQPGDDAVAGSGYRVTDDAVEYFDSGTGRTAPVLRFKSPDNNALKRIELTDRAKTPPSFDFIDPKYSAFYSEDQIAIIVSYENTDKKSFVITSFDLMNDRILWQLKQSVLDESDYVKNYSTLNVFMKYDHDLIFNSGGLLVRADSKTGKIKWIERQ